MVYFITNKGDSVALAQGGVLLLDATYTPVDGLKEGKVRDGILKADFPQRRLSDGGRRSSVGTKTRKKIRNTASASRCRIAPGAAVRSTRTVSMKDAR